MSNKGGHGKSASGASSNDVGIMLARIDEQNEQINRLQTKFRDVTHAYKSLLAEKQALEITLKALKTNSSLANEIKSKNLEQPASNATTANTSRSASASDLSDTEGRKTKQAGVEASASSTSISSKQGYEDKIAALTSNIQIILENKAKMEASYVAEKKKLRNDLEEMRVKYDNLKVSIEKLDKVNENKVKELKTQLKQSQGEREKLTQDLNNMIKVASPNKTEESLANKEPLTLESSTANNAVMHNLRIENMELKTKLKNLTKQFENKCEELVQNETEMRKQRAAHDEQIRQDETQMTDLRKQLKETNESSEKRIQDLETSLSQLCTTIASYEAQLSSAKTSAPAKAKSIEDDLLEMKRKSLTSFQNDLKQNKLDFDAALEQITQLKAYLESQARDLNINFNFNEIWLQSDVNKTDDKKLVTDLEIQLDKLNEENKHLKEEYEKYKIRTNYLIKSAKQQQQYHQTNKEASQDLEHQQQQTQKLKEEVEGLRKRVMVLDKEKQEDSERLINMYEARLGEMRKELRSQIDKSEQERLKTVTELEKELVKQRERTSKLLADKDSQLDHIKLMTIGSSTSRTRVEEETDGSESVKLKNSSSYNSLDEGSQVPSTPTNNSTMLLYYDQQNAYKETELNRLRIAYKDLEYKLKQTLDEHSVDLERLQNQIKLLKEEIERLKLNQSRADTSENMEYIKNVVYNFMTSKDPTVRTNMSLAIMQILKFTRNERQKIQSLMSNNKFSMV